ncbi:DUF962 domain-containing protein [Chryseobacterium camelliae]|uniref:DUF962 domain-containing protein n=1 Tax=Chryseobacterium camelliae TaxID=1265445 RepID=A0ABY7QQR0_9FLAO|nr:DUF962 domain-containing protein [Chryseobacterium camelliae]WBV61133.1 DUF962 domain-containing protein [Chryseobacterium camelliae]
MLFLFTAFFKNGELIAAFSAKINTMPERIKTFKEFYLFYLTEHRKTGTRIFHFIGTLLVFVVIGYVISSGKERFLWYIPIFGYGFAWLNHALIEKNKPATFKYPLWSLVSDFRLFFELLTGKQKFIETKSQG